MLGGRIMLPANVLKFTCTTAGSIALNRVGNPVAVSLIYSIDGGAHWQSVLFGQAIACNVGDELVMCANTNNSSFSNSASSYYQFVISGEFYVSGSIMYLLSRLGLGTSIPQYAFYNLFKNCAAIKSAPDIPATSVGEYSCYTMFEGCTGLTSAPNMNATTVASNCFRGMFYGCTNMATAPDLPAKHLAICCYYDMFHGCAFSSVKIYGENVGALSLAFMFYNCHNLNNIEVHFSAWGSQVNDCEKWVNGVAANGDFTCPAALPNTRDVNHIPTSWNRIEF